MKKVLWFLLLAMTIVSCSKKTEVSGKIANASPLERIEFIEASGVTALPLINIPVSPNGEFSGEFEAPKNGIYVMTCAGQMTTFYLKKGQNLQITSDANDFEGKFKISGDAKANNDFLANTEKKFQEIMSGINQNEWLTKDEKAFLESVKKLETQLNKAIDDEAKKINADKEVVNYKKDETKIQLASIVEIYGKVHGRISGNVAYKPSQALLDYKKEMTKENDRLVKQFPQYRSFLLESIGEDFDAFAQKQNPTDDMMMTELFGKYLETKKEFSQITKDYMLATVLAQFDINPMNAKNFDKITKITDEYIKNGEVKSDLKKLQTAVLGFQKGTVPNLKLQTTDGKSISLKDLKGRPTLVTFYTSWNPNIAMNTVPMLKEVADFYKTKMDFAFVNLDDTKEQFQKTSSAMFSGFPGKNYWIEGGINSKAARDFAIFGFTLPHFILVDKDGKLASRRFYNLGDPELVSALDNATGLKAPQIQAEYPVQIQVGGEAIDSAATK
ncbi:TlpA family protein disulfide reductase [Cruoricaptor ignavus]|uniref:TlpA family protein disulfide reductase n=1 Tax=Cruoricaptor ignavus TaxID=1118202 RepID=UPI00370D8B1B